MKPNKNVQDFITAAAAVILVYVLFDLLGIGCPIKFVTGISCLGCGMTRAWLSLLRLDLKNAFYYHPGFWIPPLALAVYLLNYKKNIKFYKIFMFTSLLLFVIIYFVRLLQADNDIVVFHPENNILFRAVKFYHTRGGFYVL